MSNIIADPEGWCQEHKNDDEFGGDLGKCMEFAESYKTGGKRKRTRRHHKRSTHKRRTHKRRTHRKRTHRRRH